MKPINPYLRSRKHQEGARNSGSGSNISRTTMARDPLQQQCRKVNTLTTTSIATSASTTNNKSDLTDFAMDSSYPKAESIPFPYERPYPQQLDFMNALLEGIHSSTSTSTSTSPTPSSTSTTTNSKLLVLESPTGTGKSLSLACASLAWLEYQEKYQQHQQQKVEGQQTQTQTNSTSTSTSTSSSNESQQVGNLSWVQDWQPEHVMTEAQRQKEHQQKILQEDYDRLLALETELRQLRMKATTASSTIPSITERIHQLRQAMTRIKVASRKRKRILLRKKQQQQQQQHLLEESYGNTNDDENTNTDFDMNDDEIKNNFRTKIPDYERGSPEWLLQVPRLQLLDHQQSSQRQQQLRQQQYSSSTIIPKSLPSQFLPSPKIIYAARTHSQLSQFVREVRRTYWGKNVRVVALGSRSQGLCGYLQKKSSGTTQSQIHQTESGTNGSQKVMSEATLTEKCYDLRHSKTNSTTISSANGSGGCPYHQSDAMATLALHSLAFPTDIEDMVQLGQATHTCAYYSSRKAVQRAQMIVVPYNLLIDASTRQAVGLGDLRNTLLLIDEAHNLPQAIQGVTSIQLHSSQIQAAEYQLQSYTKKYICEGEGRSLNARNTQLLGQLKIVLKGLQQASQSLLSNASHSKDKTSYTDQNPTSKGGNSLMLSMLEFTVKYKLVSVNLFPILRYMKESRLSQKLLGFLPPEHPKHISPMSQVESFLIKLNGYDPRHAQILIQSPKESSEECIDPTLKIVVLNPAVHAQDALYHEPLAVCLVGGTLQPMDVLVQELVPHLMRDAQSAQLQISSQLHPTTTSISHHTKSMVGFACGHVVSSDNVLLQALTHVGTTSLELKYTTKNQLTVMRAIGEALIRMAQTVPHGMVVFLSSYAYERALVECWQKKQAHDHTSIWDRLSHYKPIFREPSQPRQMEATLSDFAKYAEQPRKNGHGGALLLAVVGGKLSEGINFANRLCRCVVVVGVPYADRSDPILQEKLRLLATASTDFTSQTANTGSEPIISSKKIISPNNSSQHFYQSLCLRAVNQSVGRAIRHADDFATIVLMDRRYSKDNSLANGLPQWLTHSTPGWRRESGSLEGVVRQLKTFFANPKFRDDETTVRSL